MKPPTTSKVLLSIKHVLNNRRRKKRAIGSIITVHLVYRKRSTTTTTLYALILTNRSISFSNLVIDVNNVISLISTNNLPFHQ